MRRGSLPFRVVAVVLLFVLVISLNQRMERTAVEGPLHHSLYLPSGKYLRVASLGFHVLVADLLYIWSIQYYSDLREDRWRYLARLYDVITDLDPSFLTAYTIGGLILAIEAKSPESAVALLDKGMRNLPDLYILPWEAGFHAREMGDAALSSRYFRIAKDRPDAPAHVARLYGRSLELAGDDRAALRLFEELAAQATDELVGQVAARYVHDLTIKVHLKELQGAVSEYFRRSGHYPRALAQLVEEGLLASVPLDPDGGEYTYDRRTGEVATSSLYKLYFRYKR